MVDVQNLPLPPESDKVEYRLTISSPETLARDIAAFANSGGGRIIFGVRPRNSGALLTIFSGGEFWNTSSVSNLIKSALNLLSPRPSVKYSTIELCNEQRLSIDVQPSPAPIITADGHYFVRTETASVLIEENLIEGLATAVPSIKPNLLNALGINEEVTEKAEDSAVFTRIVHRKLEETTNVTKLYEILLEPIKRTRDETTVQMNECRWQKRLTFIVAFVFLIITLVLVSTGILLIFTSYLQVGVVTTVASILSGIVSGLAFTFNKQANDRNDKFYKDMIALEKYYATVQCIPLINDKQMMNETLRDFIKTNYQGM